MNPFRWLRRRRKFHKQLRSYHSELQAFRHLPSTRTLHLPVSDSDLYPCFGDNTTETPTPRDYVLHTAWAARAVAKINPPQHIDVSSCIYFPVLLSAFIPVTYYEFRPVPLSLSGMESRAGDLNRLPLADRSVSSLSCLHVLEHIGLGRYGDPLDPDGDLKAMAELQRVLAPGGHLLVAVPVGRRRVCFNAHRVYNHMDIVRAFNELSLLESSLIDDTRDQLHPNAPPGHFDRQNYGCGCFQFRRPE